MHDGDNTSPADTALPESQLREHKEVILVTECSRTPLPARALFGEGVIVTGTLQFTRKPLEPGGR